MRLVDLNSDMGEGFGPWTIGDGVDEHIMPLISSANIATGFHAGDPTTMAQTVKMAAQHGVSIGAHPGFRDLVGFGRRHMIASADELVNDILYQVGALREIAKLHGLTLQHVKPHGALYMHVASNDEIAELLVEKLHALSPELMLYAMHGSNVHKVAKRVGHPVICEFYADRDYDLSGSIVFTRRVGALDPEQVAQKVLRACQEGKVRTVEGEDIPIEFDSICIHSDTPGALALVEATYKALHEAEIDIRSPSQS
ncbi:5-oxoprolinase subunit PxpA [Marinomonas spartinae]|uniref:5-oxoprolinase subunit PxpA n=1 Tax=Marinomonas spartinae TaxID=1792290 RepID=UPI001F29AF03|nr:5-oxoprolinase subunit PxpA [Marinomonas spartinae]